MTLTRQEATPRAGRRTGWRRVVNLRVASLTALLVALLVAAALAVAYATTEVPSPNALAAAQASIVYYADGRTELDRISEVNRVSVPLSRVPLDVQRAVLAAEDREFYAEGGVSVRGTVRALLNDLRGGPTQGGSTITQQYVKNYFLSQDQRLGRKAREALIALKIDRQLSKSQILENYLNTIYFGRGAYGIQTAAQAYFGVDVARLTLAQGALLAAVINAPSRYDPRVSDDARVLAATRFAYVLGGMAGKGWISAEQRSQARLPTTAPLHRRSRPGTTGYVTAAVRVELSRTLHLTGDELDRGGLRITTTIDRDAQDAAVTAVREQMPTGRNTSHLQVGLAAVKPGDGAVVALYGGWDYAKNQFSAATQAHLQGGSTFKVFGLLAALREDISTRTRFNGRSPQYFPQFAGGGNPRGRVVNSSNEQFGSIDLRTALADSVNTVFAQLNIQATPKATRQAAIDAGLPANTPGLADNYTNILGTASPRVLDMATAYATVAAQGMRATPYLVKRVRSVSGTLDYHVQQELTPAFDKDQTADVTDAMQQVVRAGTGRNASLGTRPAAGKTGTTSANKAVWFGGFTPQLATAVGMFNEVNGKTTSMVDIGGYSELYGGNFPAKIWAAFMRGALRGERALPFPARAGVGDDKVVVSTSSTTLSTPTSASSTASASSATDTSPTTATSTSTTGSPPPSSSTSTTSTTRTTTTSSTTRTTRTKSTTSSSTRATTRTSTSSTTATRPRSSSNTRSATRTRTSTTPAGGSSRSRTPP